MLTWSTSTTSQNIHNSSNFQNRKPQSRAAEEFLASWDSAVFDEVKNEDPELDEEAKLWRSKFAHLRITGHNCAIGVQIKNPDRVETKMSKSAYTTREKPRDLSLPKILKEKTKKK